MISESKMHVVLNQRLWRSVFIVILIILNIIYFYYFYILNGLNWKSSSAEIKMIVKLRLNSSDEKMVVNLNSFLSPKVNISNKHVNFYQMTDITKTLNSNFKNTEMVYSTNRPLDKTAKYLKILKDKFLNEQQNLISYEMEGYNFTPTTSDINSLILKKGGEPIRNLVFATWRSGSTFLGDLLNSHPGTFYHYEPLLHMKVKQVRSKLESADAIKILTHLLTCNYTDINEFTNWEKYENQERNQHNNRIWRFCKKQRKICEDPDFIAKMCKLFPIQTVKTVRIRLKLGKKLLEDKGLKKLRLLLLVRDPRGIMMSRRHRDWCYQGPDCIQAERLCDDMEEDFKFAKILRHKYPNRFLALRYEDISVNPFKAAKKIFKFYQLQFHPNVNYFLQTHTVKNHGGVVSTYRDSSKTPFRWIQEISDNTGNNRLLLEAIQATCGKVMENWGYKTLYDSSLLSSFNPLGKPPWSEMLISK